MTITKLVLVLVCLCGPVYLELQVQGLTAIDDDYVSNGSFSLLSDCKVSGTADAAAFLSLAAPTTFTDDVTKDIALPMSHRGLSRARKAKTQRLQNAVTRIESCRNTGRPVESISHFTPRDLLHRLCIQRI
jgi:hypothetical protein